MYGPAQFDEPRQDVLLGLLRQHPLATLITLGPDGLHADHIPMQWQAREGSPGVLKGHVARANPLWQRLAASPQVLAVFQGPQSYISPNWYASKADGGRVVPTWNYVAVHVAGTVQVHDDPVWLRALLDELTATHEAAQTHPWALSDAPADFQARLVDLVVGVALNIHSMQGKWKISQNRPETDQAGVVQGLRATGAAQDLAMADLIAARLQGA